MYREDGGNTKRPQVSMLAEGVTDRVRDRLPAPDPAQRRRCVGRFVFFELSGGFWEFFQVFQRKSPPLAKTQFHSIQLGKKSAGPDKVR